MDNLQAGQTRIEAGLAKILEQTTKTNGRVGDLEKVRAFTEGALKGGRVVYALVAGLVAGTVALVGLLVSLHEAGIMGN